MITVTTKNLTASSVDFPKYQSENAEESSSESALGSIQGLVSGLNPAGMVKKATVVGMKPKVSLYGLLFGTDRGLDLETKLSDYSTALTLEPSTGKLFCAFWL